MTSRVGLIALYMAAVVLSAGPTMAQSIYGAHYLPDAIDYAGSMHLHLLNDTGAPLEVTNLLLDGDSVGRVWRSDESFIQPEPRDQYLEVTNSQVAWYRVYPNPIPPGEVCEIIARLMPEGAAFPARSLTVRFDRGESLSVEYNLRRPPFEVEYIGISKALDALYVYARVRPDRAAEPIAIHVDGRTARASFDRIHAGLRFAKVSLGRRWDPGSYHAIAVEGTGGHRQAVLQRALPTPPPIAIMGNLAEEHARQYASHLFDVHIAFVPPRQTFFETLTKFGLRGAYISYERMVPGEKKCEPVYYNDPEFVAPLEDQSALWAHFLEDEPDGRYHRTNLSHLQIRRDVERANQFCRILDRNHPTYLQMDHGGYPSNMYTWGQIPDYIATHAYPFGQDIVARTRDHVEHTAAGSRPRPFIYLCEGYSENQQRQFSPDEMRLEVLTALAFGAKSLQWYPAHGSRGLLEHPRMWDAVGRMNAMLHQVLPLLSIGTPVADAIAAPRGILARMILCGDRAVAVVAVNRDFESTAETSDLRPARNVTVRLRLPEFMRAPSAVLATPDGPIDLALDVRGATASFTLEEVGPGAIVVIYGDDAIPREMRSIASSAARRFQPMAADTPNAR